MTTQAPTQTTAPAPATQQELNMTTETSTSTNYTSATISTLSGAPLRAAYIEVIGEEPSPRAPVIALRRRVIAELKRREAEEASMHAAAETAHAAAVEMIETAAEPTPTAESATTEPATTAAPVAAEPAAPTFSTDDAMRAASEAVKLGADAKVCSDAVAAFEAGEIDAAAVQQRIVDAIPVAEAPVAAEPASEAPAAEAEEDAFDPTAECAECGKRGDERGALECSKPYNHRPAAPAVEPATATPRDAIDLAIERARSLDPAAQKIFLDGFAKKELLAMVERVTGVKTSGRLSPASAVARIQAALAPVAPTDESAFASAASTAPTEAPASEPASECVPAASEPAVAQPDMIGAAIERLRGIADAAELKAAADATDLTTRGLIFERLTGLKRGPRTSDALARGIVAALRPAPASPAQTETSRARAAELPPIGTVLRNLNARTGEVRAECKVVENGVLFNGQLFKSLSAAAIAATHALGNQSRQTSGPRFWGLLDGRSASTPRAASAKAVDFDGITKAWDRYRERVEAALVGLRDEDRAKLQETLAGHATAVLSLAGKTHEASEEPEAGEAASECADAADAATEVA